MLAPIAPHVSEELWAKVTGASESISYEEWPSYDETKLVTDEVTVVFQINGKVRSKAQVSKSITKDALEELALADSRIQEMLEGQTVRKVIVVPGKLVNIVAN